MLVLLQVSVRLRDSDKLSTMSVDELIARLRDEVADYR